MAWNVTICDNTYKVLKCHSDDQENVMQFLGRNGIFFDANCGRQGRCQKCEILINGRKCKACQTKITSDCQIFLPFALHSELNTVLVSTRENTQSSFSSSPKSKSSAWYRLVVDVGTTTIGMALIDSQNNIIQQKGCSNSQKIYGSDVASRLFYASNQKGLDTLKQCLYQDIQIILQEMLTSCNILPQQLKGIYLTGNPVMLHIANAISPESIGHFPFTPAFRDKKIHTELFWETTQYPIYTFPYASGYIGSDVLYGAYYYGIHKEETPCLYMDLGTNGEMLLQKNQQLYSVSVPAGPAFEGVLHNCDMLTLLTQLLEQKKLDCHGTLAEPYFTNGINYCQKHITQKDIRDIQLAKSAVRTGIELLCQKQHCALTDIQNIYVAGGFGFYLSLPNACRIHMFPDCFQNKMHIIGNASLEGAIAYCDTMDEYQTITNSITNIDLTLEPQFQEYYIKYMDF